MRFASLALLALVLGCASPSRPPKPSPYHYGAVTPRAAKRFANIYRLIKAPLSPEDLVAFEGTAAKLGEFQAAMLLLAIMTGFPQLSARLFRALDNPQTPSLPPPQFFANVGQYLPANPLTTRLQGSLKVLSPIDGSLRAYP
jgi:hypothetical protein